MHISPMRQSLVRGVWLLACIMALSFIAYSPIAIRPNVVLVGAFALAFFIEDAYVFAMFLLALLLWSKYAPAATYELFYIGIAAVVVFAIVRMLVLRLTPAVFIVTLFIGSALFWVFFSFSHTPWTFPFLMEFLYNTAVGIILFAFGAWLKKRFS